MNEIMVAGGAVALACVLAWGLNGVRQMRTCDRRLRAAARAHVEVRVESHRDAVTCQLVRHARHYVTVDGPQTPESWERTRQAIRATTPQAMPRPTLPLPGYHTPHIPWSALTGPVTPLPDAPGHEYHTPRSLRQIATDSAQHRAVVHAARKTMGA